MTPIDRRSFILALGAAITSAKSSASALKQRVCTFRLVAYRDGKVAGQAEFDASMESDLGIYLDIASRLDIHLGDELRLEVLQVESASIPPITVELKAL